MIFIKFTIKSSTYFTFLVVYGFMQAEIKNLNGDIKAKNDQIATLGKQILDFVMESHDALDKSDIVQVDYSFETS